VIGGGVTCGSALVLETFLKALARPGCPEIVLLSESPCTDEVIYLSIDDDDDEDENIFVWVLFLTCDIPKII
jgi:hypothetical protein